MDAREFVWTFPVCILAAYYKINSVIGSLILDDRIRFVTPEALPRGPRALALFTDSHLGMI